MHGSFRIPQDNSILRIAPLHLISQKNKSTRAAGIKELERHTGICRIANHPLLPQLSQCPMVCFRCRLDSEFRKACYSFISRICTIFEFRKFGSFICSRYGWYRTPLPQLSELNFQFAKKQIKPRGRHLILSIHQRGNLPQFVFCSCLPLDRLAYRNSPYNPSTVYFPLFHISSRARGSH